MASVFTALVWKTSLFLVTGAVAWFFYRLYCVRMQVRAVSKKYGLPLLPHSFLFGHLIVATKVTMKHPPDMATSIIPYLIATEYPEISKRGYFYLDNWPIASPLIAVSNPDIMVQFTQDVSFPKHAQMPFEFGPFTHGMDLVTSNGRIWKTWRSIFNPGFSSKNIQVYVTAMLQEYNVFRSRLAALSASGDTLNMDKYMMSLTVDVIGHAVLGASLQAQTKGSKIFDLVKEQISLLVVDYSPRGLSKLLNPMRWFKLWRNNNALSGLIGPYIVDSIRDHDSKKSNKTMLKVSLILQITGGVALRSMMPLAVTNYLKEHSASEGRIDAQWISIAVEQFKMFLFAGHDTVSSTSCFVTALLHQHPDKLAKCREELDSVLGSPPTTSDDEDPAQALIAAGPEILNRLVYLTACIKETLRLFGPVSGSVRRCEKQIQYLSDPERPNEPIPIWPELMLYSHQAHSHRDPLWWPEPHTFIPERFTAQPGDNLYPKHKYAFRPFEHGARNCIGQELAMMEMRLVLALALREWDFEPILSQEKVYFGMNLYQATPPEELTLHPRDGMPMRVKRRAM